MSQLFAVEAQKAMVGSLLWWPDHNLLQWWGRSMVELLLLPLLLWLLSLKLPWLELRAIAPILLLLWLMQLTPRYTMWYFGGAPLELPLPVDPSIFFFFFFSSASATTFIILSWSEAALANSLYDKLERCTRRSCRWMVSSARYKLAFFSSV
jgi:hypothetical protein